MRKKFGIILGMAMMLGLSGCADNPESSIIQNKDFDNMLEEAQDTEESVDMEDMSQDVEENYDTYVTSLSDDNLHVTVNVDAKVEIPVTDKLSVYRVNQADVSQEFLDKVRNTLAPDIKMYDGAILNIETKQDLEPQIKYCKDELAAIENGTSDILPENIDVAKEETLNVLAELESKYENAPDGISFEGNESDYMLHTVSEKYAENPDSEYYIWQNELTSEGDEVFYGINDGKNGEYISLYVQNNNDYGNVIRYSKNKTGHAFTSAVVSGGTASRDIWSEGDKSLFMENNNVELKLSNEESLTISIDEARTQADKLMESLGLVDFRCSEEGKYNEIPDAKKVPYYESTYRQIYSFTYLRSVDNTFVSNSAGAKHTEGWDGDVYVKKEWGGESVTIFVNDSGIVGFYYFSPIEITETVVEKSQLKTFEEVKSTFEDMVVVAYGTEDEEYASKIDITKVVLRYARISEADNFDSGLLVPVWDFIGIVEGGSSYTYPNLPKSVITINAIDGSVIDHTLGY